MKKEFVPGQTVYSINGAAAAFVAATSNGFAVEPMYEGDYLDEEPRFGPVTSWPEVYSEPPVEMLNDKVKELEERIAEQRQVLAELDKDKRTLEQEMAAINARYEKNDQLRNLDLYLAGKVTHLVKLDGWGFKIGTIEEIAGYDNDREMRLLSIYGDTKNHYRWKMAAYSDGSGSNTEVLLATSGEDAIKLAAQWYYKEIAQYARNNQGHMVAGLARSAMQYGITISDEHRKLVEDGDRQANERQIVQAQQDFDRAKLRLEQATGKTIEVTK